MGDAEEDTPAVHPLADVNASFSTDIVVADQSDADAGILVTDHWRR